MFRIIFQRNLAGAELILSANCECVGDLLDELECFVKRQRKREERKHFKVLNDGEDRYVLCDDRTDDPAPVYQTEKDAMAEVNRRCEEV